MNQDMPETNLRALDRVLSLKTVDGKQPKNSTGMIDPRLFTGDQQLHLIMDSNSGLWSFRYSKNALLPEPLQGTFTSFKKGYEQAEQYYLKRNVQIVEIKD